MQPRLVSVLDLHVGAQSVLPIRSTFFKNVTYILFLGWPCDLLGVQRLLQLECHHETGGWGGMLRVLLKCQRTKVLPFKTSWHLLQGQALLSVSEREDGKRGGLDILERVLISVFINVLPGFFNTVLFLENK